MRRIVMNNSMLAASRRRSDKGVALIAVLLLLTLLSAVAVAMVYKVNHEQHLQGTDMANTKAYYGAEAAMEKMMADLSKLYTQTAAPTNCDIAALQATAPSLVVGITYPEYVYNVPVPGGGGCAPLPSTIQTISSGTNAGLQAQIVPLSLQVTADRLGVEEARMIRRVEVAEIPVFQFGVFSQSDLSFFAGPSFDFTGRVFTNGNLFLSEGAGKSLTFHLNIRAAGDVVRDKMANGADTLGQGRTGSVWVPQAAKGCDTGPGANCRNLQLTPNEGSSVGGPTCYTPGLATCTSPGPGVPNTSNGWTAISQTTYKSQILSGSTGVKTLTLPFVQPGVGPIEIIRRPLALEVPTSLVGVSRLYNQAQIRVLLSDNPAELPGGAGDTQNIRLANVPNPGADYTNGVPVVPVPGGVGKTFFAEGKNIKIAGVNQPGPGGELNWTNIPVPPPAAEGFVPAGAPVLASTTTVSGGITTITQPWNLLDGYLRVEYRTAAGNYLPITTQWLQLGFARGVLPPTTAAPNIVNPSAILILQAQADRNGNGSAAAGELVPDGGTGSVITGPATRNNWYPINMYDTREGEFRDSIIAVSPSTCSIGGVLNLIEIDVNNLRKWLSGLIPGSGTSVESTSQDGYILYVSDRRGTVPSNQAPNVGVKTGEYGFEDVINLNDVPTGNPNGILDPGEDLNGNAGLPATYAAPYLGLGFGPLGPPPVQPNARVNCLNAARVNWVSGPRHGVRLVNGGLGNLPGSGGTIGFTLASEQPAYILGNYNALATGTGDPHVSSAVMADTVTLLSNNWSDLVSFQNPVKMNQRPAVTSGYRVAIATGKNRNFDTSATPGLPQDFGTDGGVHNFLRFLEDWGAAGGQTVNYTGSMASLYYSQYATGVFKCCATVYSAPNRNYLFDTDFQDLSKMPPGTPKFRDVVNVGFQQVF
jgi:hypothetical protein